MKHVYLGIASRSSKHGAMEGLFTLNYIGVLTARGVISGRDSMMIEDIALQTQVGRGPTSKVLVWVSSFSGDALVGLCSKAY